MHMTYYKLDMPFDSAVLLLGANFTEMMWLIFKCNKDIKNTYENVNPV